MTPEERTQLVGDITGAIVEAQKKSHEEHREYWIDREEHYKHHDFINAWIEFMNTGKKAALRTFTAFMVMTILGLLVFGFWEKISHMVKG